MRYDLVFDQMGDKVDVLLVTGDRVENVDIQVCSGDYVLPSKENLNWHIGCNKMSVELTNDFGDTWTLEAESIVTICQHDSQWNGKSKDQNDD